MNESVYKTYKPASGSDGLFLKLQDGDTVRLRIASEPAIYTQEFNNDGEVTVSTKFAWVVWNRNEEKAQVFSQGKSVYNQLADLYDEWQNPTGYDVSIKRVGQMLETRYSVTPSPKSTDLTPEQEAACAKIDLLAATKGKWLKDFTEAKTEEKVEPVDTTDYSEE